MAIDQTTIHPEKNPPSEPAPAGSSDAPAFERIEDLIAAPVDLQLMMMETASEVLRLLASTLMREEVRQLAGERYQRRKPHNGRYVRWGSNPGSVRVGAERMPVSVPRVRDRHDGREQPLRTYQALHDGARPAPQVAEAILLGIAQRDYERVARTAADSFSLSQSTVSRHFTEEAARALEELETRGLADEQYLAIWMDGKQLRGRQVVIAIGLTKDGRKRVLGFVEASTENAKAVKGLLRSLIQRGLDFSEGLLVITDGSKGLRSAARATFGGYAVLQRCHWHKRENVVSYLSGTEAPIWRERLRDALDAPTEPLARTTLERCVEELRPINRHAATSLEEGLDELLTLHRLGVQGRLGRHLRTTNVVESVNARIETQLRKIKRYVSSDQRQQWTAMALLDAERRFRRVDNHRHLPLLKQALLRHIDTLTENPPAAV